MVHKRFDETRLVTENHEPCNCRVDLLIDETGQYMEYTSRKQLVTEAMARSLAAGLKRGNERGNSGGRIVRIRKTRASYGPGKKHVTTVMDEDVIDSWEAVKK